MGVALKSVFTLERFVWRHDSSRWLGLPGVDVGGTFDDRASAESAARVQEWDFRRRVNPFHFGGPALHYQTGFDAARLFDWCLDHGLDPPALTADSGPWETWWDAHKQGFTASQRAALWEALDRVRFFRVSETQPARPMHLVAEPSFENDPIPGTGSERKVGTRPYMLFRSPANAARMCDELYHERVAQFGNEVQVEVGYRTIVRAAKPFAKEEALTAFELGQAYFVEQLPLGFTSDTPPTPGREVFIVLRRGWRLEEGGLPGSWRWSPPQARSCGTPVAAFGTLEAADALVARLDAEARTSPSPFRFGPPHEWSTLHASGIWGVLSEMAPIVFTNQWTDYKASDLAWCHWWDAVVPTLTDVQIETVWSLYESLRFYEVVAVEYRD
ncbi:MAG TPA: hypothetical protein VHR66_27820 [Gemmataceae bacterium]|nr:hypothetical protein [Gemmataceae bacterium]